MNENSASEPLQDDPPRTSTTTNTGNGNGYTAGSRFVSHVPLRRAHHGRMLAGVAAGIADYLGVDVTIVRIAFVVATMLGGAGIPAYLACLLLIPEEGTDASIASSLLDSVSR